jgi:hypothetical protein
VTPLATSVLHVAWVRNRHNALPSSEAFGIWKAAIISVQPASEYPPNVTVPSELQVACTYAAAVSCNPFIAGVHCPAGIVAEEIWVWHVSSPKSETVIPLMLPAAAALRNRREVVAWCGINWNGETVCTGCSSVCINLCFVVSSLRSCCASVSGAAAVDSATVASRVQQHRTSRIVAADVCIGI